MKKTGRERTKAVRFHVRELPGAFECIETESRMEVAPGWGRRNWGAGVQWGQSCGFVRQKASADLLHNDVNILNASEMCI